MLFPASAPSPVCTACMKWYHMDRACTTHSAWWSLPSKDVQSTSLSHGSPSSRNILGHSWRPHHLGWSVPWWTDAQWHCIGRRSPPEGLAPKNTFKAFPIHTFKGYRFLSPYQVKEKHHLWPQWTSLRWGRSPKALAYSALLCASVAMAPTATSLGSEDQVVTQLCPMVGLTVYIVY